jgi:hypothetical protein
MKGKSKKPAKPIAGQSRATAEDIHTVGIKVMYIGSKEAPSVCKSCGRKTIRGMIRICCDSNFCSQTCVKAGHNSPENASGAE